MNDLTDYKEFRYMIKTGDIIEFAANSLIGRLIRAKTKQAVNHTSIAIWMQPISSCIVRDMEIDQTPRLYIGEAIANGFHLSYLSKVLESYDGKVAWSQLKEWNEHTRLTVAKNALALEGRPYDYRSLFANLFGRVPVDAEKPYCSEAVQIALVNSHLLGKLYSPTGKKEHKGCGIRPGEFHDTGLFQQPHWLL